jgi:hypothetical protein
MTERNESSVARLATDVTARGIASGFAAIKVVRRPRSIHPLGDIFVGYIEWLCTKSTKSGIFWVDSPVICEQDAILLRQALSGR